MMRSEGVHHLVVSEQSAVVGVVSDRDIFRKGTLFSGIGLRPGLHIRDAMVPLERFVTGTSSLRDALDLLFESGASALPVVGPHGLAGIVTETDLLDALGLLLAH